MTPQSTPPRLPVDRPRRGRRARLRPSAERLRRRRRRHAAGVHRHPDVAARRHRRRGERVVHRRRHGVGDRLGHRHDVVARALAVQQPTDASTSSRMHALSAPSDPPFTRRHGRLRRRRHGHAEHHRRHAGQRGQRPARCRRTLQRDVRAVHRPRRLGAAERQRRDGRHRGRPHDLAATLAVTVTVTKLALSLPSGSATLDGTATASRSVVTADGTTTTTSHVTVPSATLATAFNARSGAFTLSNLDATRT
jgi:hypothetical protein